MTPELVLWRGEVPQDFHDAFWSLVGRHLPLEYGRAMIVVSPEEARYLPDWSRLASRIDPRLRRGEMRLEIR